MIRRIIILIVLVAVPCLSVSASGPVKTGQMLAEPFQVVLSASWEDEGGYAAETDTFVIDENKTAIVQYVSCRARHAPGGSNDATFRLTADIANGTLSNATILAGNMEPLHTSGSGSIDYEASADFVSACIGKHCNSFGDGAYVSLTLYASRDDSSADAESVDCLVSGTMYVNKHMYTD